MEIPRNKIDEVLRNLVYIRDRDLGHETIRPLLLIPGGAVRGAAINAGHILALNQAGLGGVFKNIVGISSGAAVAIYLATQDAAQIRNGCELVCKNIPQYVHPGIKRIGRIFDTPGIEQELAHGMYAPTIECIANFEIGLYFGVIVRKTGEFVLLNANDKGVFTKARASMTIPFISKGKAFVSGTEYLDGGFYPLPLDEIVARFQPTDILILSNKTKDQLGEQDALELMLKIYIKKYPKEIQMQIRKSQDQLANLADWADRRVNVGVLFPPDTGIHGLTKNREALRRAINLSYEDALAQIAGSSFRAMTEMLNMARLGRSL